jgi:hypothetical protein
MAAPSTYYIDTNDFSTAASVWTDLNLTIKAPDGFYSFFGNYRQQLNGILLAIDSCTSPPVGDCNCFSTTYETIPSGLQVRWRDCTSGEITTQQISNLLTRDNLDNTFTSYICVEQGSTYQTPVCVSGGVEVTCDPLTWIEGGSCSDSQDCYVEPTGPYSCRETLNDPCSLYQQPCVDLGLLDCV